MVSLRFGKFKIMATPESDLERTTDEGKTSSVHFLHFKFPMDAIAAFRTPGAEVIAGISHPKYGHMAVLSKEMRAALAADSD